MMKVSAISSGCGVNVEGINLADLSDKMIEELKRLFAEHGLLFFRDQVLSQANHLALAKQFGPIVTNKHFQALSGFPEIAQITKEADQTTNIGGGWHTDHSYDPEPAMGSILVARDLPSSGGDTRFANLSAAYAGLDRKTKEQISGLRAVHCNEHLYGQGGYYAQTDLANQLSGMDQTSSATHPVVITHPLSGKKTLYVNPGHTIQIEGWTLEDSAHLLSQLYAHVDQEAYTCRFKWWPGSVAFWDNRATWHFAENDYDGERRSMERVTLAGTRLS